MVLLCLCPHPANHVHNVDGLKVTVLAAHFHHKETLRSAQMQLLADTLPTRPVHEHPLVLADHNLVMVPGIDTETVSIQDTLSPIVRARDEEPAVLDSLEVQDGWLYAYWAPQ